ncbi:MAG: WbqC family protein [Stellaceae bacterium]
MQPYFFPYIGYFQLIAASDVFVFHDDVQYIKGGWINRNRILKDGKPVWITFPVLSAAHDLPIDKRYYAGDPQTRHRLLRRVEAAYRAAPHFAEIYPLIQEVMDFGNANVAAFNAHLIRRVAAHLRIRTAFVSSSELDKDNSLTGANRVIEICRRLGATRYINPIGGKELYGADRFSGAGIELGFLSPGVLSGPAPPTPLSIIDSLMRKGEGMIATDLQEYRIIEAAR